MPKPPKLVVTNSLLKTFRRCPRATLYKHHDMLAPRSLSRPLRRGTWFHALLEAYYKGEDWKKVHQHYSNKFGELLDEEQDQLRDLPNELKALMHSYLWHYKKDASWKVHEVEKIIQVDAGPFIYQGKVDMLVEDDFGLWVVDHKTHARIPSHTQRMLDVQSVLYVFFMREMGIPVTGFIWNYVKTEAAKPIKFTLSGRPYKKQGLTDYPTARRSILAEGFNLEDFSYLLEPLKAMRYDPNNPQQLSPFFERMVWERSDKELEHVVREALKTGKRYLKYDFQDRDLVERTPDRSCDWCGYRNLCITELIGGNADIVRKQEFVPADPLSYYKNESIETGE